MTTLYARLTSKSPLPGPEPTDEPTAYQLVYAADPDADNSDWSPEGAVPSLSMTVVVTAEAAEGFQYGNQIALEMGDATPELLRNDAEADTVEPAGDDTTGGASVDGEPGVTPVAPGEPADTPKATAKTRK